MPLSLPSFLPLPGRVLPFPLQRLLVEPLLRRQFRETWQAGDLDFLRGHFVEIDVFDVGFCWHVTLGHGGPVMVYGAIEADVVIRGDLETFVALAKQEQDPDTLFFRRLLSVTGDTEMALQVKNLLYSVEWLPEVGRMAERVDALLRKFAPPAARDQRTL